MRYATRTDLRYFTTKVVIPAVVAAALAGTIFVAVKMAPWNQVDQAPQPPDATLIVESPK